MLRLKIGIELASLRQPLKRALASASRLGARGVEIDARHEIRPEELSGTGRRALRKMLDDLELDVCALAFPTRRGYDRPEDLDRRVAATQSAMRLAHELGCGLLVVRAGNLAEGPSGPRWPLLVDVLGALAAYGQHVGTLLALRTGAESGPHLARFLAELPGQGVGAVLDPGGLIVHGFSPLEAIEALGDRILYVQASDAVPEGSGGQGMQVELGRGLTDYPVLLGSLDQHAYRGWITVAFRAAEDPLRQMGNAVQYLNNL